MRAIYSLFLYLIAPLIGLRLLWRSRRQAEYLEHLGERCGFYRGAKPEMPVIWIHAVSVGETRAAQPLVKVVQARWPDHRILLTCMTPTGRAAGQEVFGAGVDQRYLPYDYPGAVDRFFRHFSPVLGVLMETEIWPNLLAAAERHSVPVCLVNARLSARSARGYGRFSGLVGPAFARLSAVGAQTAADAERLRRLGAVDVRVCGNLKFDVMLDPERLAQGREWRTGLGERPVWLAASTREGEEALLLDAWRAACLPGNPLLVIVPRHPQRFAEVARLIEGRGMTLQQRSLAMPDETTQVWLGDSMGEMVAYYAVADLAFIGGSLLPLGGQNLIEAAACACPVLVGPHTFNFQQATEDAVLAGAALRVTDAGDLIRQVDQLLANPRQRQAMARSAEAFALAHRGATQRTLEVLEEVLLRA